MGGHSHDSTAPLISTQERLTTKQEKEQRENKGNVPVILSVEYSPASMESGSPQLRRKSFCK